MQTPRQQSGIEMLITYGLAILVVVIVVALILTISNKTQNAIPESCSIYGTLGCSDVAFSSNSAGSTLVVLASSQVYGKVNISSFNAVVGGVKSTGGYCTTNMSVGGSTQITQGQVIYCVATFPTALTNSTSNQAYTGTFNISGNYCPSGTSQCSRVNDYSFAGNFKTYAVANIMITVSTTSVTQDPCGFDCSWGVCPIGTECDRTYDSSCTGSQPAGWICTPTTTSINITTTSSSTVSTSSTSTSTTSSTVTGSTTSSTSSTTTSSTSSSSTSSTSTTTSTSSSTVTGSTTSSTSSTSTSTSSTSTTVAYAYIYGIGGEYSLGVYTSNVYYASVASNGLMSSWVSGNSYPLALILHSCSFYNGALYCIGGDTGSPTSSDYFATTSSNGVIGTWSAGTAYPTSILGQSCSTYYDYLYCVAGSTTDTPNLASSVYYTDLASGTFGAWDRDNSYPVASWQGSCQTYNDYIYCVGGYTSGEVPTTATYYAQIQQGGVLGPWHSSTAYPIAVGELSCAAAGGYLYCVGGSGTEGGSTAAGTSAAYFARISSTGIGSWSATVSYPLVIDRESCAAVSNGYIYCAGGMAGSTPAPTNAVYYAPLLSASGIGAWQTGSNYPVKVYRPSVTAPPFPIGTLAPTTTSTSVRSTTTISCPTLTQYDYGSCFNAEGSQNCFNGYDIQVVEGGLAGVLDYLDYDYCPSYGFGSVEITGNSGSGPTWQCSC